jgi:hypothetical protein
LETFLFCFFSLFTDAKNHFLLPSPRDSQQFDGVVAMLGNISRAVEALLGAYAGKFTIKTVRFD